MIMATETTKPLTQEESDHRAMLDHAFKGKTAEPEVVQRVRERADRIREELRAKGMRINAVDLIRESRDDL
jgi:hypothetical protein